MSSDRRWTSRREAETEAIGRELATVLPAGALLLLDGPMGAGKTVLVRGMASALGVDPRQVQSPSYTLVHDYEGAEDRLVHVDLYRLDPDDIPALGLDDLIAGSGLKVIEWPGRWLDAPATAWRARIEVSAGGERQITLSPSAS